MSTDGFALIITLFNAFQYLHHRESSAGQYALFGMFSIHEADVSIQIGTILMTQSLHVAFVRYSIAKVVILTFTREGFDLAKDGVIDDDAVYARVVVRIA